MPAERLSPGETAAILVRTLPVFMLKDFDADGNLKWGAGGIKVSMTSLNPPPLIINGDLGGEIIVYSFQEDGRILNAQKLDNNGQTLFPKTVLQ